MDANVVVPGVFAIASAFVLILAAVAALGARQKRTVICPADGTAAKVRTSPVAAVCSLYTNESQRVVACSHWPGRAGCERRCARQLAP
jgi:hypothetical protein